MSMAKAEPEVLVLRGRTDDRHHVRRARAIAHPGFAIDALAEREEASRDRLGGSELHRGLGRVPGCEFRARGQADARDHGSQEITALEVQRRMVEDRIALRLVMHVIAALYGERQMVAELLGDHGGPSPERDDGGAGLDRTKLRLDAPACWNLIQGLGVPRGETPA